MEEGERAQDFLPIDTSCCVCGESLLPWGPESLWASPHGQRVVSTGRCASYPWALVPSPISSLCTCLSFQGCQYFKELTRPAGSLQCPLNGIIFPHLCHHEHFANQGVPSQQEQEPTQPGPLPVAPVWLPGFGEQTHDRVSVGPTSALQNLTDIISGAT